MRNRNLQNSNWLPRVVRVSVSCAASCARQRARWARFGVCGVKVCSRQLLKENLIIHGLQLLNTSFSFRKFTSTTALNKLMCTRTPLFERLRWGRVFLERTQFLNGIQFTRHFIECIVAETKQFVGSSVNMILRRQTCGQCSSMSAGSKRRALENSFT